MVYEKEYIDLLIREASSDSRIGSILEKYLLNEIEFSELVEYIYVNEIKVIQWKSFKKDNDIKSIL